MTKFLLRWMWIATFLGMQLACSGEESVQTPPAAPGAYSVMVTGFDPESKAQAIEVFSKETGRGVDKATEAVEGLPGAVQLIRIGLTQTEAQALEARLVGAGFEVMVGEYEDSKPGPR